MTTQHNISRDGVNLFAQVDGVEDQTAPTIMFANSLGTDMRLWDDILPMLPAGLRIIRYDKRGHGKSDTPPAPYTMGALIADAEAVADALNVRDCLFVGLSIGGMIAQGLAVKRLDICRAIVLSNTGAKISTRDVWEDRIATVMNSGIEPLADAVMERWFSAEFRASDQLPIWRKLLTDTPAAGYAGCSAAIMGTDFYTPTRGLRLPALGIAGSEDGSTPPDLVRETIDLIPGSRFHLIRGSGHLPCVENPTEYAEVLNGFIQEIGHI